MEELKKKIQECIDAGGDRVNEIDCWVDDFSGNIVINAEQLLTVIAHLNKSENEGQA